MPSRTWCLVGTVTDAVLQLAESALERGDRVAIVAPDVSECARLVGRYWDAVLTVEEDLANPVSIARSVDALRAELGTVDLVVLGVSADASSVMSAA